MIKTVLIALMSFVLISGLFLLIDHSFEIEWLMFNFYEETATGIRAGGSIITFLIGSAGSFLIGSFYEKRPQQHR